MKIYVTHKTAGSKQENVTACGACPHPDLRAWRWDEVTCKKCLAKRKGNV